MKILQVVHSLPFLNQAGTELYTHDLSVELSKRNRLYVFTRSCDEKKKEYEVTKQDLNGITVYLINNTFRNCDSFEGHYQNNEIDRRFVEVLDEIKPEVVHIQHLVFLSIGLIREIKERGIPIIFTLHDYWLMCPRWHILKKDLTPCEKVFTHSFNEECLGCIGDLLNIKRGAKKLYVFSRRLLPAFLVRWLKKMYFVYARRTSCSDTDITKLKERSTRIHELLNDVDLFIAPSKYLKDRFIDFGIHSDKIRLSRNGLNGTLFKNIQKTRSNKLRFAFIGTILPAKGLHILIEAFNRINRRDVELRIYGRLYRYTGFESYLPYLKRITRNKLIRFMGEFNHAEIFNIFKEIDILIAPSIWHENSPIVIQEALSSNTPVIASRIGGIPELLEDGINGLLFNAGDSKDLQQKIKYILNNPEVIARFGDNRPGIKNIEADAMGMEEIYGNLQTEYRLSIQSVQGH